MSFQYSPYSIPLLISAVILFFTIVTAYRRRHVPGARSFIWLMSCATVWTIFYALAVSAGELSTNVFWANCQFIGIVFTPVAWLVFSLEYSQLNRFLNWRTIGLLCVVPSITLILIATNDIHHLVWAAPVGQFANGIWDVTRPPSIAFWIYTAFSYVYLITGSFLFVRQSLRGSAQIETQSLLMIVGTAVPWITNIVYLFWFNSKLPLDPTPFALVVSGIFYAWGLFRLGLFNLLPVAAETVIDGMRDGVMVIDQTDLVVYINMAFSEYTGIPSQDAMGSTAQKVLARWPELIGEFDDKRQAGNQLVLQLRGDSNRHFEMRISPLYDRGHRFGGRVFVLREISSPAGVRAVDLSSATARNKLMLLTTRANGELIEANDRFLGVLGYTRMEIFEQSSYSIWESIEQRTLLLRKCHAGGFEDLELNLVSKTNDMVPVCASAKLATLNNETYIFFGMREKR